MYNFIIMKNSQKGFIAPVLITIIALLVIGGGSYIYFNKGNVNQDNPNKAISTTSTSTDVTTDWKTYTNSQYGFTFKHPKDTSVSVLHYDAPSPTSPGIDRFYINELNINVVTVSTPSVLATIRNNADLLAIKQKTSPGFMQVEKDFFDVGKAIYSGNEGAPCGSNYESIVHDSYIFGFPDISESCKDIEQTKNILDTFKFI
jgi:hypothetical protein